MGTRPKCQPAAEQARVAAPAVLYAAKSTEDVHGSIPTQLEDAREIAQAQGLHVVGEYFDEAASAYKGDRGPALARAKEEAEHHARDHGEAVLIVQHSDRLARGDGRQAMHLVEYALWAIKTNVRILSVQDPQTFGDLLYAVVTGQRNHEDSARKGKATAAGQRRRFEAGKRLGSPIPDGYRLEPVLENGMPVVGRDGRTVREARLNPARAAVWERIFAQVEAGHTCGEVRGILNAEGIRKQRGAPWRTRDVRRGILNDWYGGRARAYGQTIDGDHPALIEPERWERIAAMVRTDERASKGGRPPIADADSYLLRRIATCGRCGSSLWTRRLAKGRMYICSSSRQATGCDADYIPAEPVERAVIDHLDYFLADAEAWIRSRAEKADKDRDLFAGTIDDQRTKLRNLKVKVEKARDQWERLLGEDDDAADAALRGVKRLEDEAGHLEDAINTADSKLADWPTAEVDAALDFYSELRDTISGRVRAAKGFSDLYAALRSIFARVALKVDENGATVGAHFELAGPDVDAGKVPLVVGAGWRVDRDSLGPPLLATIAAPTRAELEVPDTTCS